jgi:hypothetical protein
VLSDCLFKSDASFVCANLCLCRHSGSLLATEQGMSAIPQDWKNRTPLYKQVSGLIEWQYSVFVLVSVI